MDPILLKFVSQRKIEELRKNLHGIWANNQLACHLMILCDVALWFNPLCFQNCLAKINLVIILLWSEKQRIEHNIKFSSSFLTFNAMFNLVPAVEYPNAQCYFEVSWNVIYVKIDASTFISSKQQVLLCFSFKQVGKLGPLYETSLTMFYI